MIGFEHIITTPARARSGERVTRLAFELQAWEIVLGGAVAAGLWLLYRSMRAGGLLGDLGDLPGGSSSLLGWLTGGMADEVGKHIADKETRSARDIIEDMIRRKGGGP